MKGKHRKKNRIRFVPGKGKSLFSVHEPFDAVLEDTDNPRIKKMRLEHFLGPQDSEKGSHTGRPSVSPENQGTTGPGRSRVFDHIRDSLAAGRLRSAEDGAVSSAEGVMGRADTPPAALPSAGISSSRVAGISDDNPMDYIMYRIVEAADLLMDDAGPKLQERIFRVLRHALRTLLDLKKRTGGQITEEAKTRLLEILDDLENLRQIADEEEHQIRQD